MDGVILLYDSNYFNVYALFQLYNYISLRRNWRPIKAERIGDGS